MKQQSRLDKSARQQIILGEARRSAALRISELARQLGVSGETVRRDLDELGESGRLSRIYGGATLPSRAADGPAGRGAGGRAGALERMAAVVAARVEPGHTLMIGGGAPVQHVARRLVGSVRNITLITNEVGIAAIAGGGSAQAVLCPGTYDPESDCVHGEDAIEYLGRFNPDLTIIACSALSPEGASDDRRGSAHVKRAMLRSGQKAIVVIERHRLGKNALQRICPLGELAEIVTGGRPPAAIAAACRAAGVRLTVA